VAMESGGAKWWAGWAVGADSSVAGKK